MAASHTPIAQQPRIIHETFVEHRNYEQLKWKSTCPQNYGRRRKEETSKYLSNIIDKRATNWKFYKYVNDEIPHIQSLRGHTVSDCGDAIITIGDRHSIRKKEAIVDIYKLNKHMTKIEKVTAVNRSPCCRFHHSAEFIPPLNQIFFFGGFDAQCTYNDARLFSLEHNVWSDLVYKANIDYRGFHSSTTRLITTSNKYGTRIHQWECYIFGGQCCIGGPYEYHNDMFRFTFVDSNYAQHGDDDEKEEEDDETQVGYFQCDAIQYNGSNFPRARSQNHSFIKGDTLYIYGGSYATSTLNDLWALDLNTMIWTEIEYRGILNAPCIKPLIPRNFMVVSCRTPCYYDAKLDQLIVIHFGKLNLVQRQFTKSDCTLYEFEQLWMEQKNMEAKEDENVERLNTLRSIMVESMYDTNLIIRGSCTVFVFDMAQRRWFIKKSRNITQREKAKIPRDDIGNTRVMRLGEYILFVGGGTRQSRINYMRHIHLLKIPSYRVIRSVSWSRERLLWIGHYKGNDDCIFNKCAKDVLQFIISFLNFIVL